MPYKFLVQNRAQGADDHVITRIATKMYELFPQQFVEEVHQLGDGDETIHFVHDDTPALLERYAYSLAHPTYHLIFCSSEPLELVRKLTDANITLGGNVHILSCPPETFLRERLSNFATGAFDLGRPDFSLLNQSSMPEHLVGYRILKIVGTPDQLEKYERKYQSAIHSELESILGIDSSSEMSQKTLAAQVESALGKALP